MGDVSKKNFYKYFCKIKFTFQTLQTDIFWTLSWPFSCAYSFKLRDLIFGMCIKDPISRTCWQNGKDLSNGTPNIKLWNHTKKTHFPVFAKNFRRPCMKLKKNFCQFPNPWTLRVSGMGCYTSKCEKSQNHCTLLIIVSLNISVSSLCESTPCKAILCCEFELLSLVWHCRFRMRLHARHSVSWKLIIMG